MSSLPSPSPSPRLLRPSPAAVPGNPTPLRRIDPAHPALSATNHQRWPPATHPRSPPTQSTRLPWPPPTRPCSTPTRSTRPPRRRGFTALLPPGALPTEQGSLTALPPPPQAAPAMKTIQRQGAYMAAPTPPQDPPMMKGGNTVVPMPLQEPAMTVPPRGGPVLAPLPFPARPPFPMVPPYFYDVAPPMMALQPPPAGYMMGQPLFPAGPPPLKRQRHDYFDMPFGPQMLAGSRQWLDLMNQWDCLMGIT